MRVYMYMYLNIQIHVEEEGEKGGVTAGSQESGLIMVR